MGTRAEIIKDLAAVMNKHTIETRSNTSDYVLAEFLYDSLIAYERVMFQREALYGRQYNSTKNAVIVAKDSGDET